MQRKLKILFVGEASFISTGYAKYAKEVIKRLHSTGKYEIAEFACGAYPNHPGDKDIKWKYYANNPSPGSKQMEEFKRSPANAWGEWRFDKVLLDYRPDIVFDIRDPWVFTHQTVSPLRRFFHHVIMPTVDSAPQRYEWISMFRDADAVFTYSDWALKVLEDQSFGEIVPIGTAPPAANSDIFRPHPNKEVLKQQFGINPNSKIVGTVMRNQIRKLFPNLFRAFRQYLEESGDENTFLYCHTSYPDNGWNIPNLLVENKIFHKTLFTYSCAKCGIYLPTLFQGAKNICPKCNNHSFMLTNVGRGISDEQLSTIYNLFDVYVQYANCLTKNQEILTQRGWTQISDIKIGDLAWTHKNRWKNISAVWKNLQKSDNKQVKRVSIYGDYENLEATENHEFPAYTIKEIKPRHNRAIRERIGDYIRSKKNLPDPGKYELSDLNIGDMLIYPIDDTIKDINQIDITEIIDCDDCIVLDNFIEIGNKSYPRYLNINNEFCRFIGLFAADGNSQKSGSYQIKITSNQNENNNISLSYSFMKKIAPNNLIQNREYKNRSALDTVLSSKIHYNIFNKWCNRKFLKQLPSFALYLPKEKQKEILIGMFMGDGCYSEDKKISIYSTTSKILADQLKFILRRLRIPFGCSLTKRSNHKTNDNITRADTYRFEIYGFNIKNGEINPKRNKTCNVYYENYHLLKIKSIENIEYNDSTWCLTVDDDHTMTTRIGSTFQCEGFGLPILEAAYCGLPTMVTNYSAMESFVENIDSVPIEPAAMQRTVSEGADRAVPDDSDFVQKLKVLLSQPRQILRIKGEKARQKAMEYINWDKTAQNLMNYFDNIELTGVQGKWDEEPLRQIRVPEPSQIPDVDNKDLIDWYVYNVLGETSFFGYRSLDFVRNLNTGIIVGKNIKKFDHEDVQKIFSVLINKINIAERIRCGLAQLPKEDFIEYAHIKEARHK